MILSDADIIRKIEAGDIVIVSCDSAHTTNINASSLDLRKELIDKTLRSH